ncbi:hypothetical protein INT48_007600, partial [Thamnidium elegans]
MTFELEKDGQEDGRLKYYADGILRVNSHEVLILEASSAYQEATATKSTFDHYKGMFGALSILKHISRKYKLCHMTLIDRLSGRRHFSYDEVPLKLNDDDKKEANPLKHFIQLHLNLT